MNCFSNIKRSLVAAGASVLSFGYALAEGTAPSVNPVTWEGSSAKAIADAAQETLANFLTGVGGIVGLLIVTGLAIWGGIALVGVLKRAFQTGKGR